MLVVLGLPLSLGNVVLADLAFDVWHVVLSGWNLEGWVRGVHSRHQEGDGADSHDVHVHRQVPAIDSLVLQSTKDGRQ